MTTHIEGLYEVAINDDRFRVVQEQYARRFLDVIRQQGGGQDEPSEFSLNPNDLWRRGQDDWVFGQGQVIYDDAESIKKRFNSNTGWDPFYAKGDMQLSPGYDEVLDQNDAGLPVGASNMQKMVVADGYLWIMLTDEEQIVRWDGTTDTLTTALTYPVVDIASDGTNVYLASRDAGKANGSVYVISSGSTTPVLLNTIIPDLVAYVKGRLMVAAGPDLYNITDVGDTDPPAALTAASINGSFVWDVFGESSNYILVAGNGGDLSLIYRITIREDGTSLTAPVVAAQLPDAEICYKIKDYLGLVVLGTSRGVRIGQMSGSTLNIGPLLQETDNPVTGIEPQGKYVYYSVGETGGAGESSFGGLARIDLSRGIPNFGLTFAWSNYLVGSSFNRVRDVVFYDGALHFLEDTVGLVKNDPTQYYNDGASFTTGRISMGMTDLKNFQFIDVFATTPSSTSITVKYTDSEGGSGTLGTINSANGPRATFDVDVTAEWIEIEFEGDGAGGGALSASTPVLHRFVLRGLPIPSRTEQVQIMLDLRESITTLAGGVEFRDVYTEYETLRGYVKSGETVTYEEFDRTYTATVENVQWGPDLDLSKDADSWEGNCIVTLRLYE